MKKTLFLFFLSLSLSMEAHAKAIVLDGDSIILNGDEIRLIGIDAPEHRQYCFDKNKKKYNCGKRAKQALVDIVKGREVRCIKVKKDIYKRDLSECFVDDININLEMLKSGWAIIYYYDDVEYINAQNVAKDNKIGVWQGKFIRPEFYRHLSKRKHRK